MTRNGTPRLAILGAGPIGLEAALYARTLNLPVTVYERGRIAEHLQRWGHVRLFSPFSMNSTALGRATVAADTPGHRLPGDGDCITGKEHLAAYLEPLARGRLLRDCLRTETQVLQVGRHGFLKDECPGDDRRGKQPFRLLLREAKGRERVEEADFVFDCTGTYGQHRWLGDGGIAAIGEQAAESQIMYLLDDVAGERRTLYAGKTILVIGAGYSAATTVSRLADVAEANTDTWVIWLARGSGTQPIRRVANDPLRERDRLAVRANTLATRSDGNVEFHNQALIDSIECAGPDKGFRVATRLAGKPKTWEVDRVVANIGYTPDTALYRELQVHECYASLGPIKLSAALFKQGNADCLTISAGGPDLLRNPEPGFFILGAKSYGRQSSFLLRSGFDQIRNVFTIVTGKPTLDLYAQR